jgi:hypothetical protein
MSSFELSSRDVSEKSGYVYNGDLGWSPTMGIEAVDQKSGLTQVSIDTTRSRSLR